MPLQKITIPPGVFRDLTSYAAAGKWYSTNKVRFRNGFPEVIGGWSPYSTSTFDGTCRSLFPFRSHVNTVLLGVGATAKFYISRGGTFYDVTPIARSITAGANPISVRDTTTATITDVLHGCKVGDYVTFSGVGAFTSSTLTAASFNESITTGVGAFRIQSIVDINTYTITMPGVGTGSGTAVGGSSVVLSYLTPTGLDSYAESSGWGTGAWGGGTGWGLGATTSSTSDRLRIWSQQNLNFDLVLSPQGGAISFWDTGVSESASGLWTRAKELSQVTTIGGVGTSTDKSERTTNPLYKANPCRRSIKTIVAPVTGNIIALGCTKEIPVVADNNPAKNKYDSFYRKVATISADGTGSNTVYTVNGYKRVKIYVADHGAVEGDYVTVYAASAVNNTTLNGNYRVESTLDSSGIHDDDHIIILTGGSAANATGWADCSSNNVKAKFDSGINPMLVRWSSTTTGGDAQPLCWETHQDTTSGDMPLTSGTTIITGLRTRQEVLIWTDTSIYSMRYVGAPIYYAFMLATNDSSILGPNAAVLAENGIVYWMGEENFYAYAGNVQNVPCPVAEYVFDDMDLGQTGKVFAFENSKFSEVTWLYPSKDVNNVGYQETDRYVTYNYKDNIWYFGSFADYDISNYAGSGVSMTAEKNRTAWVDAGAIDLPIAAYQYSKNSAPDPSSVLSSIYYHETGLNGDSSGIQTLIESGYNEIVNGDQVSFISKVIPDVEFKGSAPSSSESGITMTVYGKSFPESSDPTSTTGYDSTSVSIIDGTTYKNVRSRAREVKFIFNSASTGYGWKLGVTRVEIRPDGRR